MMYQKHLIISGRVQGVGFRAFALDKSRKFGIKGWIKNRSDGKVEAVVQGKESDINRLLKYFEKGPAWARVDNIEIENENKDTKFKSFTIK
ncbi:MAG: acylphosphatase [bacterium]